MTPRRDFGLLIAGALVLSACQTPGTEPVAAGPPTPAEAPASGQADAVAPLQSTRLILPGRGYWLVSLGMPQTQVHSLIGEPQLAVSPYADQYHDGFAVMYGKDHRVKAVMCGGWCEKDAPMLDLFEGQTDAGIGLGSTSRQVIEAYGEPDVSRQIVKGIDFVLLRYDTLGVRFALRQDHVVHVTVVEPVASAPR